MKTICDRSSLVWNIREFFQRRGIIEVHTPVLGSHTVSDFHIDSISVKSRFLQTSPEYYMKRLLASGVPSCYQIGPVFREGEAGRWHNPEFMMLEWYRIGFDSQQLREEVKELVNLTLGKGTYRTITYQALIGDEVGVDVFGAPPSELARVVDSHGYSGDHDYAEMCDFLYSHALDLCDCPRFFVVDFPVESAALAKVAMADSGKIADRFELIVSHVELANGYNELLDPVELERRVRDDNERRKCRVKSLVDPDERLLDAMRHGLPPCSGVAVGLDRLIALALQIDNLSDVMAFPADCA